MRWFYAAFWILIGTMLFLQFNSYNKHLDQVAAAAPPRQEHFFYVHGQTNAVTTTDAPPQPDKADVQQVAFSYDNDTPTQGYFTCHVVLMNKGTLKAQEISVQVSPYRGIMVGDDNDNNDNGLGPHAIDDNDPLAQINQWVSFPDLAPGESKSADVSFMGQPRVKPGHNPNPQIIFHAAKPDPAAAAAPAPSK